MAGPSHSRARARVPASSLEDESDVGAPNDENLNWNRHKRSKHTFEQENTNSSRQPDNTKRGKSGGPTRSNKEHAGDVLAAVGETGAGEQGGDEGKGKGKGRRNGERERSGKDADEEGTDGDDEDEGEDEGDGDGEGEGEGEDKEDVTMEEESIVASMYEEGQGDDALYVKLLSMVQELTKEHKVLHEKITQLTIRLEQKEATSDVDMEPLKTNTRKAVPKHQPTQWKQEAAYDRPAGRRAQDPTRLLILAILALLGRKNRKELLPDGPPDNIAAPSEAMFYVKWTESEKSEFNRIAAGIVANKVMKDWPALCPEEDRDTIQDMVIQHIRYLIKLFKRQRLPSNDPKELTRRLNCSADTRKRTLFEQRLKVVSSIDELKIHRQLIVELGIDGTSSDEEDAQNPGKYLVKRRKELSNQVRELKQKIDLVYKQHYKAAGSRGSQVRNRVPSGKVSTRQFRVKNLPKSVMSKKWLSTLTEAQIALWEFNDYEYDFSFPDELLGMM
ncbi:hypothetical protein FRC09_020660 [Ceratobasidium sp. 395]|nr:hypothetical protein FRC09_020660 [Ceratobasidium sp. 395]